MYRIAVLAKTLDFIVSHSAMPLLYYFMNPIATVKRTNGQLRLEQKLRELESEAWQD